MCDPVTMAIIAGAQGAAQVQGQQRQASAERRAHRIATAQAGEKAASQYAQSHAKLSEVRERAAEENEAVRRQALAAGATAAVSAGESGVAGGQTTNLLFAQFEKQRMEFETRKAAELEGHDAQALYEADAIEGEFQSTFLRTLPKTQKPSFLGSILTIGGSALGGYATGKSLQTQRSMAEHTPIE